MAKRCIDDEQAPGGEEITFSAWVLIIYTASLLQIKNVITEKKEIILNKWYFSGCIACKDVSLLNYFAVLTVQERKKFTVYSNLQGLCVINFPVELFLQSQGLIKVVVK